MPATARAVIIDTLGQPVPLHRPDRILRMHDQARQPLTPRSGVGGLVGGQPGAARRMAELDMDGPAGGGAVGDLLPAPAAAPGQRGIAAAAGELLGRVLGGSEQRPRPDPGRWSRTAGDDPGGVFHIW